MRTRNNKLSKSIHNEIFLIRKKYLQELVKIYGNVKKKLIKSKKINTLVIGDASEVLGEAIAREFKSDRVKIIKGSKNNPIDQYINNGTLKLIGPRPDIIYVHNWLDKIYNDLDAISEFYKKLNTGGVVIGIVPAHQALYSSIDKSTNSHRRYGLLEINKIFKMAGFKVIKSYYFDPIGAVFGLLYKLTDSGHGHISKSRSEYYDRYFFRMSIKAHFITGKLFGKSIVFIAVKH